VTALEDISTYNDYSPSSSNKMPMPINGALGIFFLGSRLMQAICLVTIIGLTSNFISLMVSASTTPPSVLIGTLSITIIAIIYLIVTMVLYFDNMLSHLIGLVLDALILVALIVVAVTVGKPLSYLDCFALSNKGGDAESFLSSVGANMSKVNYWVFVGVNKTTCLELKSIWGLSIALCILFSFSMISSGLLWKRQRDLMSGKSMV
jgi:hypothetical protein